MFRVIFAGMALKLEKVGPSFSSFSPLVHPSHPLQQTTGNSFNS